MRGLEPPAYAGSPLATPDRAMPGRATPRHERLVETLDAKSSELGTPVAKTTRKAAGRKNVRDQWRAEQAR